MVRVRVCKLASVLEDVAWLMTQHPTRDGAQFYEIARKWLWDNCEQDRNFCRTRVLLIMNSMISLLKEMPTDDKRVLNVNSFLELMCQKVATFAREEDPRDDNREYDYYVLNVWKYTPIQR